MIDVVDLGDDFLQASEVGIVGGHPFLRRNLGPLMVACHRGLCTIREILIAVTP